MSNFKLAAVQYGCKCNEISWKECLKITVSEETMILLTVEKKEVKMTERKPVILGDLIPLADGWHLLFEGYRRPCDLIAPWGQKYCCSIGSNTLTVPERNSIGFRQEQFLVDIHKPETFTPAVNWLVSEIDRVDGNNAFIKRVTSESGLKLLCRGGLTETALSATWVLSEKQYVYLSEKSIGMGGKIYVSVSAKGYDDIHFWVKDREAALEKILNLVTDGVEMKATPKVWIAQGNTYLVRDKLKAAGMKWKNRRWESVEKPTVMITGVEFVLDTEDEE